MPPERHRFFNAMIRFESVTYAYPGATCRPVLADFSLTIHDGESLAIMGSNGSGKTTFGLLLAGILKPDAGAVTIERGGVTRPASPGQIGFLFQDPDNGLVATTVEREVAFSLENRNMPPQEMRAIVASSLEKFNIGDQRKRLVWKLSGGEKQRLSLAGVFAAGPNILFLDEPASFLDYTGSRLLDASLQEFKSSYPELTIIRVTQYASVAEQYPRMVIFDSGAIMSDGTPEEVFSGGDKMLRLGLRPPLRYLQPREIQGKMPGKDVSSENENILEIDKLTFGYEDTALVFDGFSLSIRRGEVIALAGASGCGKSTLAQLVCGIYEPIGGSITNHSRSKRAVMSFQQPERQFFLETAFEEVAFSFKNRSFTADELEKKVAHHMGMAGVDFERYRDRDPHSLSGGEARRLAFAIVSALEAELIIFDEPTCALDEAGIRQFVDLVRALQCEGKTIVLISHNSDIIAELSDRVALVEPGNDGAVFSTREYFTSSKYEALLSQPEIIRYQLETNGEVQTLKPNELFDLSKLKS